METVWLCVIIERTIHNERIVKHCIQLNSPFICHLNISRFPVRRVRIDLRQNHFQIVWFSVCRCRCQLRRRSKYLRIQCSKTIRMQIVNWQRRPMAIVQTYKIIHDGGHSTKEHKNWPICTVQVNIKFIRLLNQIISYFLQQINPREGKRVSNWQKNSVHIVTNSQTEEDTYIVWIYDTRTRTPVPHRPFTVHILLTSVYCPIGNKTHVLDLVSSVQPERNFHIYSLQSYFRSSLNYSIFP